MPPGMDHMSHQPQQQGFSLKMLLSNSSAGSIIGKGGEVINNLQAQSGVRIKLSQNREFFPGTNDRVLMLTGETGGILIAQSLILAKLQEESMNQMSAGGEMQQEGNAYLVNLKLLVPNAAAGLIIGKGGEMIRTIMEESGCRIQISTNNEFPGVSERIVHCTGSLESAMKASAMVVSKMQEDPSYSLYHNMTTSYSGVGGGPMGMGGMGGGMGMFGQQQGFPQPGGFGAPGAGGGMGGPPGVGGGFGAVGAQAGGMGDAVTIPVPDSLVGGIVGRGGSSIREIQQYSGATIKISQKGEYVPGTNNRIITLTGNPQSTQAAAFLIAQKIQQLSMASDQMRPPAGGFN